MLLIKWDVKKDKYKKTEEGKESKAEEEEEYRTRNGQKEGKGRGGTRWMKRRGWQVR